MKHLITNAATVLAIATASFAVSATPINGGFSISGGATPLGSASMATATGVAFSGNNAISNCTGDLATILGGATCGGATGTVNNIAVGTVTTGNGGAVAYSDPTWITLSIGGVTFAITSITAYEHSSVFKSLSLAGTGLMSSTAGSWTPTIGEFSFTAQGVDQTFSFSSSQVSSGSVPVPGSLALLGLGMIGAAVARKAAAKK